MAKLTFGGAGFNLPSPMWIKILFYALLAGMTQLALMLPELPVSELTRTWLKIILGVLTPALAVIKDGIGKLPTPPENPNE